MAKHLVQLRRGTKEQWKEYEKDDKHLRPQAGELVVEFDAAPAASFFQLFSPLVPWHRTHP